MKRPLSTRKNRPADPAALSSPEERGTAALAEARPAPSAADEQTAADVRLAVAAALDKKAEELKALRVGEVTTFTDYFIVCSGQNPRQVQAISDAVDERLRTAKRRPLHVEGYASGQWVLMDYGDFVLHVFLH